MADEERYKTLTNGAVYDLQAKRIVKGAVMSSDGARAMVAKKREKAIASQMRGLAAKEGIALPKDATDEEILNGALDGIEALTSHMKDVFLKSNNIRGLAEAYSKLVLPMVGQPSDDEDMPVVNDEVRMVLREIAIYARKIEKQSADVIDAE